MSYDKAENRLDQVLKVIESGGSGGCSPMYYARVNFCKVLRHVATFRAA